MEKIKLKNDIVVSSVCLGAMNFGTSTDEKSSFAVLDAYVDAGGNFIDTSNNYAHWQGTGDESETLLGKWLKERKNRDKVVIATKVGFDRHGEGAGLKRGQIEFWIDESLRKLGTDYVDIYYAHSDDAQTPIEETVEAFDKLVKKGKVRMLGASNFDTWRFDRARAYAKTNGLAEYTIMQQRFSYLYEKSSCAPTYVFNEYVGRERLRYLKEENIPLVAYSCLCKGGYERPERLPQSYEKGKRLEFLATLAAEKKMTKSALVISYLTNFHRTGETRVIPLFSSSTPEHFLETLSGADIKLTDEELLALKRA